MVGLPRRDAAGAGSDSPLISLDRVRRHRLANGLTVLVRRDASAPVAAIVTFVSAGYFDETDDVVGIAHVLEHMYFKGTPSRAVGQIAKETKALGGYLNAGTIYDHTSYYTVLPSSAFAEGLAIQADAYANSLIDSDELRRELEVIIEEAKRKADNPGAVATETLYELLHDVHRIRRWRIGREEGLRTFTADAVRRFYRSFYHPANTIVAIVGDVDEDAALAAAERRYGALPAGDVARSRGPHEDGRAGFRYREIDGDILQTQLAVGWRAPGTLDPDAPALDLLGGILASGRASRLYRAVRDRQLVSSISAYHYTPTDLGVFVVHAECRPERTTEALPAIWHQLQRVREGDVAVAELERAKRIYESRWIRQLEDMEGQANYLAGWEAHGDWTLGERYLERLLTRTPDDLADVARRWLSPDDASVLVYRPRGAAQVADAAASMRGILERPAGIDLPASPPVQAVVLPRAPTPPEERVEGLVAVHRTSAGVPLLVRSKPAALLAHIGVYVMGGASLDPPGKAGLTALMARTAARASVRRSASRVSEDAELLGGSISASTGSDSVGWSISVPTPNVAAAVELLADVVQHPSFPDDLLETERAAAIAGVVAARDDMYRHPMRLAMDAAFAGHPYGIPASGTEESLAAITRDDAVAWHREQVLRGAAVVGVVGDGAPRDLAALLAGGFAELRMAPAPPAPVPQWPTEVREIVEPRARAQSAMAMLFPGAARRDDDRFAMSLIGGIASGLGGRFFDELRERQSLCYTVQTFLSDRRAAGTFVSYIATSPEKERAARDGLLAEFAKLRDGGVTMDELRRAQTYAVGVHQIRQQSGAAVLGEMIDAWMFGDLRELGEVDARINAVTLADIRRVAERYFDPSVRVEGVVRGTTRA